MPVREISKDLGRYLITEGVTSQDLNELARKLDVTCIQIDNPISAKDIDLLEECIFSKRPDILFRIYAHYGRVCDLTFIERIPSLRKVSADCLMEATGIEVVTKLESLDTLGIGIHGLKNFDFLDDVSEGLNRIHLHKTASKKPKIDGVSRFKNLEHLYLEGQQKGIDSINDLKNLKTVVLRSISTDNVDYFNGLNKLISVDVKLGGIKKFDALSSIPELEYLELWQVRDLNNLSFISELLSLQKLYVQSLRQVEKIPSLVNLTSLKSIYLENMKGLIDLSALEFAPALENFTYFSAENQQPEDLKSVLKNKSLKKVSCRFGSDKKNNDFDKLARDHGKST